MDPAIRCRLATLDDWPPVQALRLAVRENQLTNPDSVTRAHYDAYLTTEGRGWVAEENGTIRGFSIANRSGLIWALFVAPGHEAQGIGTALLALCTDWLRSEGVTQAFLETGANTRAETFYRRAGWRETGRDGESVSFVLGL